VEAWHKIKKLDELAGHNCGPHLNYPFDGEWHFLDRRGTPVSVRISGSFFTNSGEALRKVALEGAAVCLMAGFLIQDDLEAGRLVRLLPEYRTVELSMNAVYPHRHHLSAKVRTFIDLIVHHSAEQQKLINPYS
jgi:DNA-binding transcriptional LysR family regulator